MSHCQCPTITKLPIPHPPITCDVSCACGCISAISFSASASLKFTKLWWTSASEYILCNYQIYFFRRTSRKDIVNWLDTSLHSISKTPNSLEHNYIYKMDISWIILTTIFNQGLHQTSRTPSQLGWKWQVFQYHGLTVTNECRIFSGKEIHTNRISYTTKTLILITVQQLWTTCFLPSCVLRSHQTFHLSFFACHLHNGK